jgi:hypothetical protein
MAPRAVRMAALVALASVGGCSWYDGTSCDALASGAPIVEYGLFVVVRDSLTNAPLAVGTVGTAMAGGVTDALVRRVPADSTHFYQPNRRTGLFRVHLARSGCVPWVRDRVRVFLSKCDGGNQQLAARLQALRP